ncbi:MAG TPA: hypothetical protein VFH80_30200 [Solirubrobacteraceae bacterium]|nr:hypothetical protein [Solirubrobacteraceae bacterium]
MKSPFTKLWGVLRGDKYMLDAYPPAADATADAAPADRDTPSAPPPKAA